MGIPNPAKHLKSPKKECLTKINYSLELSLKDITKYLRRI